MKINFSEKEGIQTVQFIGNLDGNTSDKVATEVCAVLNEGMKLVIDMTECPYVSSAGLRALLLIGKTIKMNNGSMQLKNLCEEVQDIMEMTGFAHMFKSLEKE